MVLLSGEEIAKEQEKKLSFFSFDFVPRQQIA